MKTDLKLATMTEATIYWDSQDPSNEGWAYRVRWDDGKEVTGEWEWEVDGDDLGSSIVHLASSYGTELLGGEVAIDGLCGSWLAG